MSLAERYVDYKGVADDDFDDEEYDSDNDGDEVDW